MGKPKTSSRRQPLQVQIPESIEAQPLKFTERAAQISTSKTTPTRVDNLSLFSDEQQTDVSWKCISDIWPQEGGEDGGIVKAFLRKEEVSEPDLHTEQLASEKVKFEPFEGNLREEGIAFLGDVFGLEPIFAETTSRLTSLADLIEVQEVKENKQVVAVEYLVQIQILGTPRWVIIDRLLPVSPNGTKLFPYQQSGELIVFYWMAILFKVHLYLASLHVSFDKRTLYSWAAGFHLCSSSFSESKVLCAVADIDWPSLQAPRQDDFRFGSFEEFNLWKSQLDGEEAQKAAAAAKESEETGVIPVNPARYEEAQNVVIANQESLETLLKSPQRWRCLVVVEKGFASEILTLKKRKRSSPFAAVHYGPIDRFQEKTLSFQNGTRFVISESCESPFKGSYIRLDGLLLAEDGSFLADTEQTLWINKCKLSSLAKEGDISLVDAMDASTLQGSAEVSFQIDVEQITRISSTNFTTAFYVLQGETGEEVSHEDDVTTVPVVTAFHADPLEGEANIRLIEYSLQHKDIQSDQNSVLIRHDHGLMHRDLQFGRPYCLCPSKPATGKIMLFSSAELKTASLAKVWFECRQKSEELEWFAIKEATKSVMNGSWEVLARVLIEPSGESHQATIGGDWLLSDPRLGEYVQVLLVNDDTGHEERVNLEEDFNFQWISPRTLHSRHHLIVVLTPLPFDLPPMEFELELFFTKGAKVLQLDCSAHQVYAGTYLPNRNNILIRDKVVLPKSVKHFSLHFHATGDDSEPKANLRIISCEPNPEDFSIQESDNVLASSQGGHLHWAPCEEGGEFIFEATLVCPQSTELPYWDVEQVPEDTAMSKEDETVSVESEIKWFLHTHSASPGLSLERDATWEDKFAALRKSWESKEKGRLEKGMVARTMYSSPNPEGPGQSNKKKVDQTAVERLRRAAELGRVTDNPLMDLSAFPNARVEGFSIADPSEEAKSFQEIIEIEYEETKKYDELLRPL